MFSQQTLKFFIVFFLMIFCSSSIAMPIKGKEVKPELTNKKEQTQAQAQAFSATPFDQFWNSFTEEDCKLLSGSSTLC